MYIEEVGASEYLNEVSKLRKDNIKREKSIEGTKGDQLDISQSSKFQRTINEALAKAPEVREGKVKELNRKIKENKYNVSSEEIADKIMRERQYNGLRSELFGE